MGSVSLGSILSSFTEEYKDFPRRIKSYLDEKIKYEHLIEETPVWHPPYLNIDVKTTLVLFLKCHHVILLVEQCGPQWALLTAVTLPLEVNPHILSLADTKKERKNTFCGHYVKNSHQKPFHIVENRGNNIFFFFAKTENHIFFLKSSYGLMVLFHLSQY